MLLSKGGDIFCKFLIWWVFYCFLLNLLNMSVFGKPFLRELRKIVPNVEIDHKNKNITMKRGYFFGNKVTEAYLTLKYADYNLEIA